MPTYDNRCLSARAPGVSNGSWGVNKGGRSDVGRGRWGEGCAVNGRERVNLGNQKDVVVKCRLL